MNVPPSTRNMGKVTRSPSAIRSNNVTAGITIRGERGNGTTVTGNGRVNTTIRINVITTLYNTRQSNHRIASPERVMEQVQEQRAEQTMGSLIVPIINRTSISPNEYEITAGLSPGSTSVTVLAPIRHLGRSSQSASPVPPAIGTEYQGNRLDYRMQNAPISHHRQITANNVVDRGNIKTPSTLPATGMSPE